MLFDFSNKKEDKENRSNHLRRTGICHGRWIACFCNLNASFHQCIMDGM